jgi:parallel beta-helix repeat protein
MYTIYITPDSIHNIKQILNLHDHDFITIYLDPGKYYINNHILIKNKKYINILGNTDINDIHNQVEIIQTSSHTENICIENSNHITIRNITFIASEGRSVCTVITNSNNTEINNCRFISKNPYFCIYYSGPSHNIGKHTLKEYKNNNLDCENIFCNNIIHSNWEGDCVTFALQKNGKIFNNIIKRGKIALYMITDCSVYHNYIFDSLAHGIICSLPSKNVLIKNNYIKNSKCAGINVMKQLEHGNFNPYDYNINIDTNTILDSKYIGIEIKDGICININDNKIVNPKDKGIYFLRCKNCLIENNNIKDYEIGIFVDILCSENIISGNLLCNNILTSKQMKFNILLEKTTENNKIITNKNDEKISNFVHDLGNNIIIKK